MKFIAFLLLILGMIGTGLNVNAYWNKEFIVFEETVYVTRGPDGEALIQIGEEIFALGDSSMRYHVNQVTTDGEHYIVFGYIFDRTLYTYDAFIWVIDLDFEEMCHHIIDLGDLEEFTSMFLVEDTLIFQIAKSTADPGYYQHVSQHFLIFDETYASYEMIDIDEEVIRIVIQEDKVYLSDNYHGRFHTAFDTTLQVYKDGIVYGLNDGHSIDRLELYVVNHGWLEGSKTTNNIVLDYPGYYQLEYDEEVYLITIDPYINGVQEGLVYDAPITLFVSKGFVYLNNDMYLSNTMIQMPGNYLLAIEGSNGYLQEITFALSNRMTGIEDQMTYQDARTIAFVGEGYLNGQQIHSGYTVSAPGDYRLELYGVNGYQEIYDFSIENIEQSALPVKTTLMVLEIGLIGISLTLAGVFIYKSRIRRS